MQVWFFKWDYPYDNDELISVWADELSALKAACFEINFKVEESWDIDRDERQREAANKISDAFDNGSIESYRSVLEIWNEYQTTYNDQHGEWYFVYSEPVQGDLTALAEEKEEVKPFKETSCGATCRGPCKQHNESAYSDHDDGTYMCRQCSFIQRMASSSQASKLVIEIKLGNDGMLNETDVSKALTDLAEKVLHVAMVTGNTVQIMDVNGNSVGTWRYV